MKKLVETILYNQHRINETINIYVDLQNNIFTTWNSEEYRSYEKELLLSFTYNAESLPYSSEDIESYLLNQNFVFCITKEAFFEAVENGEFECDAAELEQSLNEFDNVYVGVRNGFFLADTNPELGYGKLQAEIS